MAKKSKKTVSIKNTKISNIEKLRRYFADDKLLLIGFIIAGLVLIFIAAAFIAMEVQKNSINQIGDTFNSLKQQLESQNLSANNEVSNFCFYPYAKNAFDDGPVQCGSKISGVIEASTADELNNKFTQIKSQFKETTQMGMIVSPTNDSDEYTISDKPKLKCNSYLSATTDLPASNRRYFIECDMPTYRQYYPKTNLVN